MPPLVVQHRHGPVHALQLARPPVNALDPALCDELRAAVDAAVADGAHGIVLSGGPRVFSAGLDVPHLLALSSAQLRDAWEAFFGLARTLAACPVPVAAAIDGHAPAGGCVLALCCDYRVMADGEFRIGLNETQVGLVAPEGIQRLLRRVVGPHRAERLLVAGEMVDARQALRIGLVDALAEPGQVAARAQAWVEALLTLPRTPVLATRAIARAEVVDALAPGLIQLDRFLAAWNDPDTQSALHALVAKLGK